MAVFTNSDIKKRRELLKMTAATLAEEIGRDPTTVYNWESGKCDPDPDTMYQIADVFGDLNCWYDYMRTKYTSYARLHPDVKQNDLPGAMMTMYAEIGDLLDIQRDALRDAADGKIDNPEIATSIGKEATEALGALQRFMNVLKSTRR
ncbi:MAG: helix-turn-helix transcriptional regulator [Clostridia bacterium]